MSRNQTLFEEAQRLIPGGVDSPVRSFSAVGGIPRFFKQGKGPYVIDEEDKTYIDYVGSWGPLIAGHAHPFVLEKLTEVLQKGTSFGAPCALEIALAVQIQRAMPAIEKIRFVNSGTEATMTAIRLARGYTQRTKILKFMGNYHGHVDALLVQAGSGILTLGHPSSAGIPTSVVADTLLAPYNDTESVHTLFARYGAEMAAVIIEPIAGNMGFVIPDRLFLETLRTLCNTYRVLLIWDEVMTGFRVGYGGAQAHFNIIPDLTTLGKVIGGGLPVGAVGGKAVIMDHLSPIGAVYQAGTLSGNPLAMAAGIAMLTLVQTKGFYTQLQKISSGLIEGLIQQASYYGVPFLGRR